MGKRVFLRDVAPRAADDDGELALEVERVRDARPHDVPFVADQRIVILEEQARHRRHRAVHLAHMDHVVEADADQLGRVAQHRQPADLRQLHPRRAVGRRRDLGERIGAEGFDDTGIAGRRAEIGDLLARQRAPARGTSVLERQQLHDPILLAAGGWAAKRESLRQCRPSASCHNTSSSCSLPSARATAWNPSSA